MDGVLDRMVIGMPCKKGVSYCDYWEERMEDCPGCEEAKKIPRAECSICHLGLIVELKIVDGRHLNIKTRCPNHGYISARERYS